MSTAFCKTPSKTNKKKLKESVLHDLQTAQSHVTSIILSGGKGTRLFPLTESCAKPNLQIAGRYRLIDIPISNCLNSGIHHNFIVTQYLSNSLNQHLNLTFPPVHHSPNQVQILAPEENLEGMQRYEGTADCIRKNLKTLLNTPSDYFLILSGDQLYNIDFQKMIAFAKVSDANLVIASIPVQAETASRMGILQVDKSLRLTDFIEKPQTSNELKPFLCPKKVLKDLGSSEENTPHYLASMGIYLFKREALIKILSDDPREDFGKHLIPTKVKSGKVYSFLFDDYWEDIGTIRSFYEANIKLTQHSPHYKMNQDLHKIYSQQENLSPSKISSAKIKQSIICDGCSIDADSISNSIIGPSSYIGHQSIIRDSYLIGNDPHISPYSVSPVTVGKSSVIEKSIIDKHATIGDHVRLVNANQLETYDGDGIYIRDGIIIVTRGTHIPDGFIL
jgi:glucose-1-phosphate adenylyltransferase